MKKSVKLMAVILPLFTSATLLILLVAGGMPQFGSYQDLLALAMQAAPITIYMLVIGGATALSMEWTGMDLSNSYRAELIREVVVGHTGAWRILKLEVLCWLGWATLWTVVALCLAR